MKFTKNIKISKVYIIGIPVFVFGILTIFMAIESASLGAKLIHLESRANSLEKEKRELEQSLINSSSLLSLSGKTEELGFGPPASIIYISPGDVVAQAPIR